LSAKQSNFAARYAITRLLTLHIEGIVYALVPDALNSCPRANTRVYRPTGTESETGSSVVCSFSICYLQVTF